MSSEDYKKKEWVFIETQSTKRRKVVYIYEDYPTAELFEFIAAALLLTSACVFGAYAATYSEYDRAVYIPFAAFLVGIIFILLSTKHYIRTEYVEDAA